MSPAVWFGSGSSGTRRAVAALVRALTILVLMAPAASAQELGGEAGAAYRAAVEEYEALTVELRRSFNRYERALDVVNRSRVTGSGREEAFAAFQTVAVDHMALEMERNRAAERMNAARAAYLRALGDREDELMDALAEPDLSRTRQAVLEAEWQRVRREMLEVEPAGALEEAVALRPVPELRVEPTDGPTELREKANFMQQHVLSYDSIIGDLDRAIEDLEDNERRLRGLVDLQRDLDRFGGSLLPGTGRGQPTVPDPEPTGDGPGPEEDDEGPAQAFASLPLSEQIELLRGTRALAVQYREEALAMADVFRERAEEFGP